MRNNVLNLISISALSLGLAVFGFSQQPSQSKADEARSILESALKDKNPDTRKEAVVSLSLTGTGDPFAQWLDGMLDDKDVEVRVATVASLVETKTPRTLPSLRKALKDDVPEVSFAAAKALYGLNDPEGKAALLSVVGGEMKTASNFLTKQKRDAIRLLHTPRPMMMMAIKTGAGFVPVPGLGEGVASMTGLLSDAGVSGRAAAALLLGRDKGRETLAALKEALADRDWSVRAAAVHSLALRNDMTLAPSFAELFDDKKEAVRLRAAAAYSRLELIKKKPVAKKAVSKPASK